MGMAAIDHKAIASEMGGDLDAAMDAVGRGEQPDPYNSMRVYGNSKLWVAWWVAALKRELPEGLVIVAVSPGSALGTNLAKEASAIILWLVIPLMRIIGPLFKMTGSITAGAKRYLDASEFGAEASGKFYASPPGKMIGPLQVEKMEHFYDRSLQDACFRSVVRLSGVGFSRSQSSNNGNPVD